MVWSGTLLRHSDHHSTVLFRPSLRGVPDRGRGGDDGYRHDTPFGEKYSPTSMEESGLPALHPEAATYANFKQDLITIGVHPKLVFDYGSSQLPPDDNHIQQRK